MTKPIVSLYWLKINRRHQKQQHQQAALENSLHQAQTKPKNSVSKLKKRLQRNK
ncbi:MAG: hypothetical protein AAF614_00225 [Chloroflexota bacterium]